MVCAVCFVVVRFVLAVVLTVVLAVILAVILRIVLAIVLCFVAVVLLSFVCLVLFVHLFHPLRTLLLVLRKEIYGSTLFFWEMAWIYAHRNSSKIFRTNAKNIRK